MSHPNVRRWCPDCDRYVLAETQVIGFGHMFALCLFTCGLAAPVCLLLAVAHGIRPPARCPWCGSRT